MALMGGHCPACGQQQVVVDHDYGTIACKAPGCPEPDALEKILADPRIHTHVVKVGRYGGWTIRHPLIERLDDRLFDCDLPRYMNDEDPVGSHVIEPDTQYVATRYHADTSAAGGPIDTWSFARVTDG